MIEIAIVDDDEHFISRFREHVCRYERENGMQFDLKFFRDGMELIAANKSFDILFLDIEMKTLDGLATAKEIRKRDEGTVIIFVTNMAQYAINGYEVCALDFIVKPVKYSVFAPKMERAVEVAERNQKEMIWVVTDYEKRKLCVKDIEYAEVAGHRIIYHLPSETIETWDTMKKVRERLEPYGFCLCNACYLVNLQKVKSFKNDFVIVGKETLKISRQKKESFLKALTLHLC